MKRFLILLALGLSALAFAADAEPKEWEGTGDASLLLTTGNTSNTTIGFGGGVIFRPNPWTFKSNTSYLVSKSAGIATAESFSVDGRGERAVSDIISFYGNLTHLTNRFGGFLNRTGAEAGIAIHLFQNPQHRVTAEYGMGALYEYRTDFSNRTFVSARLAVLYTWKLTEMTEFGANIAMLEDLGNMSDWRLNGGVSITTILNSVLSFRTAFKLDYMNLPVRGKVSTDTTTTVSLVAKF